MSDSMTTLQLAARMLGVVEGKPETYDAQLVDNLRTSVFLTEELYAMEMVATAETMVRLVDHDCKELVKSGMKKDRGGLTPTEELVRGQTMLSKLQAVFRDFPKARSMISTVELEEAINGLTASIDVGDPMATAMDQKVLQTAIKRAADQCAIAAYALNPKAIIP